MSFAKAIARIGADSKYWLQGRCGTRAGLCDESKSIVVGTYLDWLGDNAQRCLLQFELAQPDQRLKQDFINAAMPLIETQMLYAGYRLAYVLNMLF